jgi:hypothetical protein
VTITPPIRPVLNQAADSEDDDDQMEQVLFLATFRARPMACPPPSPAFPVEIARPSGDHLFAAHNAFDSTSPSCAEESPDTVEEIAALDSKVRKAERGCLKI